jgi:hypothetical protein
VQLELPALHAGSEVAQIPYLLPREPDIPQGRVVGGE